MTARQIAARMLQARLGAAAPGYRPVSSASLPLPIAEETRPQRHILLVEDEILIRMALAEYLRECGYAVLEAGSGDEAIAVLQAGETIDIVFSDVQMPGGNDGFALARWIRENRPGMKLLLTSGVVHAAAKAEELCLDGAMVRKPYDHARLLEEIRRLRDAGGAAP